MNRRQSLVALSGLGISALILRFSFDLEAKKPAQNLNPDTASDFDWKSQDEAFWKARLSEKEFKILRQAGTERARTGRYWNSKEEGIYHCAGCDLPLFDSKTKYVSGTGWPSFYDVIDKNNIIEKDDFSFFGKRTETLCARCEGHLGHVFSDGPDPTGLRYCMNGYALKFKKK